MAHHRLRIAKRIQPASLQTGSIELSTFRGGRVGSGIRLLAKTRPPNQFPQGFIRLILNPLSKVLGPKTAKLKQMLSCNFASFGDDFTTKLLPFFIGEFAIRKLDQDAGSDLFRPRRTDGVEDNP